MLEMQLHVLIAKKRITQRKLSEDTGIRQATISLYCNNTYKHLVKEHIEMFCEYFGCTIGDLLEYVKVEDIQKN